MGVEDSVVEAETAGVPAMTTSEVFPPMENPAPVVTLVPERCFCKKSRNLAELLARAGGAAVFLALVGAGLWEQAKSEKGI